MKITAIFVYRRKKKSKITPGPKNVNFCSFVKRGKASPVPLLHPHEQH